VATAALARLLKSRLRIVNSNKLINSMIRDALTIG
jgi:hypothetical protein